MECHLAARQYYDADEVWDELHVGMPLELERDIDNRFDKNAVAVVLRKKNEETGELEEFKLGYIPNGENEVLAQFLEMDWKECFECRISKINPEAHYENQIRLTVKIVRNEKNK